MAETRAELVNYCFRQLPSASVDIRDVRGPRMEAVGLLGQRQGSIRKWKKFGRRGLIIASARFRHLPRTSVDIRDVRVRVMEAGELLEKDRKIL